MTRLTLAIAAVLFAGSSAPISLATSAGAPAVRSGSGQWPVTHLAGPAGAPAEAVRPSRPRFVCVRGYGLVPFRLYVERVTQIEWRGQPFELLRAAALAVRQYAEKRVARRGCLRPTTADQLYRVVPVRARVKAAVASTWSWTLVRGGHLVFTSYRSGRVERCGYGAGHGLFAAGARACVRQGWGARRILETYYGAQVVLR